MACDVIICSHFYLYAIKHILKSKSHEMKAKAHGKSHFASLWDRGLGLRGIRPQSHLEGNNKKLPSCHGPLYIYSYIYIFHFHISYGSSGDSSFLVQKNTLSAFTQYSISCGLLHSKITTISSKTITKLTIIIYIFKSNGYKSIPYDRYAN